MGFRKDFPIGEDVSGKAMAISYFESKTDAKKFSESVGGRYEEHETPIDVDGKMCFATVKYPKE